MKKFIIAIVRFWQLVLTALRTKAKEGFRGHLDFRRTAID
jgi:hypothetical protein